MKEKYYVKCYLVGNDKTQIIAEVERNSHTYADNSFNLYHFRKGKDLITGTPIILTHETLCAENTFSNDILIYGFNRVCRLGVQSVIDIISKQSAIDFLKELNKEDICNYTEAIKNAKVKHTEMLKRHIKQIIENKKLTHKRKIEMKLQKDRIKRINNND